jgi:hypothetical protein
MRAAPSNVAIIGVGTSLGKCEGAEVGGRKWRVFRQSYGRKRPSPRRRRRRWPFSPPLPRIGGRCPGDMEHEPCQHASEGLCGRRQRGGGRWKAHGPPQGRDDGDKPPIRGRRCRLPVAADEGRPAQSIDNSVLMVLVDKALPLWALILSLTLLPTTSKVHVM